MGKPRTSNTLVALDIQGSWNLPLLKNAADINGASLLYAASGGYQDLAAPTSLPFEELAEEFDVILGCETGVKAKNIFQYPSPRGKVALVVGNEEAGIAKDVLKRCSATVTIPMYSRTLSSVNVAASGAVGLYVLERNLARNGPAALSRTRSNLDLLLGAPDDPAECGSVLRSAAAFGIRRVYLNDPAGCWFSRDRDIVSLSRAAARREVNSILVIPGDKLNSRRFSHVIYCNQHGKGVPLSKYRMEGMRHGIAVYGMTEIPEELSSLSCDNVYVDFKNGGAEIRQRHESSIFFAMLARQLRGQWHG